MAEKSAKKYAVEAGDPGDLHYANALDEIRALHDELHPTVGRCWRSQMPRLMDDPTKYRRIARLCRQRAAMPNYVEDRSKLLGAAELLELLAELTESSRGDRVNADLST